MHPGVKRIGAVVLAGLAAMVLLDWPQGVARRIRIEGFVPMDPASEDTWIEVWFPEPRVLFDSLGRQWHRDECGRLIARLDPNSRYSPNLSPTGKVVITLTLTSWMPPRRCTVSFGGEGLVTRYARNAPCAGMGTALTVRLPTVAGPTRLVDDSEP